MKIMRAGSRPTKRGPESYFAGAVLQDAILEEPDRVRALSVSFAPGARTAWHTHPLGQTLIVTFGRGRVQRDGGPIEEIRQGDVVWFAPEERHWHGAAPDAGMSHIAIQEVKDGKVVTWLEHVTDADYGA